MVTQAAAQSGEAARKILEASANLSKQSETLNAQVERFLKDVRSQ
ncbi:MAG: hypothetical protein VW405_14315 [Rhodospirillaceae bacterium]